MLTAQALREIEEEATGTTAHSTRLANHIHSLLADRKALVELLTSALPYVDPDDVMYSQDGKARVRALHNKIRSALQEDR